MNANDKLLDHIIASLNIGIALLGANAEILDASNSLLHATGYDRAMAIGRSAFEFIISDETEPVRHQYEMFKAEAGKQCSGLFRIRHADGEIGIYEVEAKNFLENPEIRSVVLTIRNQPAYSAPVRLSEISDEILRSIMGQSFLGIMVVKGGRIFYANPGIAEITGFTTEELERMGAGEYLRLFHPADRALLDGVLRSTKDPLIREECVRKIRVKNKHAAVKIADLLIRRIVFKDGPAYIFLMFDITEREEERKRLEASIKLFTQIEKNCSDITSIIEKGREILGFPTALYLRVSGREIKTMTFPPSSAEWAVWDQVNNTVFLSLLTRDSDEPLVLQDITEKRDRAGINALLELGYRSLLGQSITVRGKIVAALCLLDREPRRVDRLDVGFLNTLTRILSIEEERKSRESDLRDLLDIIAHEIRHPMAILQGYAQVLLHYKDKIDAELQAEMLGAIPNAVSRMEKLIQELVSVTKMERVQFSVMMRKFAPRSILERIVAEFKIRFPQNEFLLSCENVDSIIHADPIKLQEVLVILMENAVNYSPPGSLVEVEAKVSEDEFLVAVFDRGYGVPVEERGKIFERFYQVGDVNHHSTPGIGLGLYVAREIIKEHGGRIWCADREGGGSVFIFTVPI